MKLNHLTFIHNLLWNEENKRRYVYEAAKDNLQSSVEYELPDIKQAQEMHDELYERWREAKEALDAFESREW
jgi:predicted component of type VI protein secretion system